MKGRNEGDKLVKQFSKITPELNCKSASTYNTSHNLHTVSSLPIFMSMKNNFFFNRIYFLLSKKKHLSLSQWQFFFKYFFLDYLIVAISTKWYLNIHVRIVSRLLLYLHWLPCRSARRLNRGFDKQIIGGCQTCIE